MSYLLRLETLLVSSHSQYTGLGRKQIAGNLWCGWNCSETNVNNVLEDLRKNGMSLQEFHEYTLCWFRMMWGWVRLNAFGLGVSWWPHGGSISLVGSLYPNTHARKNLLPSVPFVIILYFWTQRLRKWCFYEYSGGAHNVD